MKKTAFLVLIICSSFLLACESNNPNSTDISISPDSVKEVFPTDESIPEDLIIRLNRTVCLKRCPAYLLTVKADGKVNFFGQDFVETKGQVEGEISEDKLKQLIAEFKKAKFFSLENNYLNKNCSEHSETVRTTLFINDKVKKIEHDRGCDAPKELNALEDKIDEIVGTQKWIGDKK